MDELLAQRARRNSQSEDLDGTEIEDELRALLNLRQNRTGGNEFSWYDMLPGSQMEEQTMLQAALKASFEENKDKVQDEKIPEIKDQNSSTKTDTSLPADPCFDETSENGPNDEKIEALVSENSEEREDCENSENNPDPPPKDEKSD